MQKQTTVTIDQKTFATLDRLAKSNDVSKKEFLSCALEYFEKYGINPVQHESPAKEMQKLIKRCDQVIAFIRKQEQDILRPACAAISTTEARIERVLDKLATAGQVRDLQKAVSDQQQRQNYDARNLRSDILQLLGRATEQERKPGRSPGSLTFGCSCSSCCCAVLSFGASSRKVTFGKRSRKRPVRLGNGRFRYPRMKTRLLSAILFGAYSSQGRQDRESPRVSQCPCSLSSSARDLPGSCTISSSRLLTMI